MRGRNIAHRGDRDARARDSRGTIISYREDGDARAGHIMHVITAGRDARGGHVWVEGVTVKNRSMRVSFL